MELMEVDPITNGEKLRTAQKLASKIQGYLDGRRRIRERELRAIERFVRERAEKLIKDIRERARGKEYPSLSKALWGLKGSLKYVGVPKERDRLERLIDIDGRIFTDLYVLKMALERNRREGIEELSKDLIGLRERRKELEL